MTTPPSLSSLVLAVALAAAACGCVTPALWRETAACAWQPSSPGRVCLFTTTNQAQGIAVFFHQSRCGNGAPAVRPALWCLSQPASNLVVGRKAIHTVTNSCSRTQDLRLRSPAQPAAPPAYTVHISTNTQILVHADGFAPGPYALPVIHEKTRTATRLIGLPFLVAGDAAVLATVVGAAGAAACTSDIATHPRCR